MRKLLSLLLLLLALIVTSWAQNKKVAVWETMCSDNSISPLQSTMVRGGMETAVGNTPGYEVYDRSAFDAIMKEHNFQRSGAVDEKQIRQMGVMVGVKYIIVPEAIADRNEFYILVKMLDVETGKFGAVYDALCGPSGTEIKKTCSELGIKLFGITVSNDEGVSIAHSASRTLEPLPESFSYQSVFVYFFKAESYWIENNKVNKTADNTLMGLMDQYAIKGFRIQAWVSPDFEAYGQAQALAEKYAIATINQIKGVIGKTGLDVSNYKFETIGTGPDWEGFFKLVEQSSIKEKDAILYNVMGSSNLESTIKEMLMVYPELEKDIFPRLCRAEVFVY